MIIETNIETIDDLREEYGDHNGLEEGDWLDMCIKCPQCGEFGLRVEPNMQLSDQEGATSPTLVECEDCSTKYHWGYVIQPTIYIAKAK